MPFPPTRVLLLIALACVAIAIAYGIAAGAATNQARRTKHILLIHIFFGLAACLTTPAILLTEYQLPTLHAQGTITSISIHSQGKDYRSEVVLQLASGGDVHLFASGRSNYFRPGQRADLRYQSQTGDILYAQFLTVDGHPEGVFRSLDPVMPYFPLLAGIFTLYMGWRRYKRDRTEQLESPNPA